MAHSKKVADVDANQAALLTALVIHSHQSLDVILDGHFALLTASGITTISVDVFRAIDPSAIVVVTTDPRTASSRLAKRDGRHYAPDLLQSLQEQEIMQADRVARSLDVPFLHGPSFVTNELAAVIRGAHGRGRGT